VTNSGDILKLQAIVGYEFKSTDAVAVAICHPGLKKHAKEFKRNFERLEFLGDRVLGLALSKILYETFQTDLEGELAVRIATFAGTNFLINIAKKSGIIDCFAIPKDFFVSTHKNSSSIADMFEAVVGAIFLDSDFETAQTVIARLWNSDIHDVEHKKKDAKTKLQEISQANSSGLPIYRVVKVSGEAHNPVFEVEVAVCGKTFMGFGNTKKSAEHDAAKKMIGSLKAHDGTTT
jgi:ribonuclease-3